MPVWPGTALRLSLLVEGSAGHGRRVYIGLAPRRATRILIRDAHGHHVRGAPADVPVRDGFYAVVLPRATGPVRLKAVTATGAQLGVVHLRDTRS